MKFSNLDLAVCLDCGLSFHRGADEAWKTRCIDCFKRAKQRESEARVQRESEAAIWQAKFYEENARNFALQQRIASLTQQLAARPADSPLDQELRAMLPRLRQLCHPDRHSGSVMANRASQWLNGLHGRLN